MADYVARVRRLDWQGLRDLWAGIEAGTARWAAGKALEHLVLRAFELSGATVRWPFDVPLAGETVEQIDGAVHVDGLSCLVECKDTVTPTNVEPIAKLRNQLLRRHSGAIGLVFSRAGFTPPAQMLAQFVAPQTVLLWNGSEVAYLLEQEDFVSALRQKYRHCAETGAPDFDTREEVLP